MTNVSIRRADFMMVLAYASDLATGHSRDFALKSCVLAMRIADRAGVSEQVRRNAYHQSMLRYVGCNADTDLLSATFGDEIALRQDLVGLDMGNRAELGRVFVQAFKRFYYDLQPDAQAKAVEAAMSQALAVARPVLIAHCEVAQRIGERLGLSGEMGRNLGQIYERWDGKGLPRGLSGEEVLPAVQLITLAQDVIALSDAVGIVEMAETVASRGDGPYAAHLARLVAANAAVLMEGIGVTVDRETILALEPDPPVSLDEADCDEAFLAIADMIDMRMPFTQGHSRMVAELAEGAGRQMGLPAADVRALRWAGCIHDIGELVVPVATWMRNGPLSVRERDAAQLHAYYGERALASFGREGEAMASLVLRHHERLDGSGYHRKVGGSDLSPAARILAAAEAFQTSREERPHRRALSSDAAATQLRAAVREGSICPDAAEAVLSFAGQRSRRAPHRPLAGMTPREIEVLRLIAAGLTAKEAGRNLDISPKTADHHIQNVYAKIGVTTRAAAALYAVEHGLVRPGETKSSA
ncbi:LuxR C-terminal-related transcriptional regulator [Mesorhizobium sp. M0051]|uniref:HD domain-containing phosphohydrolase n=1 Tax=unclassified Mesorhizobium TaxID=325217 RepID=UPI0003CF6284|nr:HD domain-containing phosphohydrolase [Mesorhizobium sp. LNHC252B00]ESY65835.1 LuxR family transcriptional regulator [Mesorhizobium sp. LNHC252B00]